MYKSTKQKSIGFHLDFSKRKEKKETELIKQSLPNLFKRLAGKQKASPQNDVTFFKVNLNVTKNKTLFTYRFLFFTQLH